MTSASSFDLEGRRKFAVPLGRRDAALADLDGIEAQERLLLGLTLFLTTPSTYAELNGKPVFRRRRIPASSVIATRIPGSTWPSTDLEGRPARNTSVAPL